MATSKSGYQVFQTQWQEAVNWATQNHISQKQWYPVYQLDSGHLIQYGYGMSQGARINAIRSAAGLPPTPLPQDKPPTWDVIDNIKKNADDLFAGFDPLSMAKNFFDSVTNGVEHPWAQLIKPVYDLAPFHQNYNDFRGVITGNHSALGMLVPGMYDLGVASKGKEGLTELADSPITTILDAIPASRIPMEGLARTGYGAALADRLGVSTKELGRITPGQLAMKKFMLMPAKTLYRADKVQFKEGDRAIAKPRPIGEGRAGMVKLTQGDVIRDLTRQLGASKDASDLIRELAVLKQTGSEMWKQRMTPFNEAWDALDSPELKKPVVAYLLDHYHIDDLRTDSEIINGTGDFNTKQLKALEETINMAQEYRNLLINDGTIIPVRGQFKDANGDTVTQTEYYLADEKSRAKPIIKASNYLDIVRKRLIEGKKNFDELVNENDEMGNLITANLDQFDNVTQTVKNAIQAILPDLSENPTAKQLKSIVGKNPGGLRDARKKALAAELTLGALIGFEPVSTDVVTRADGHLAEPLSGSQKGWNEGELAAWTEARNSQHVKDEIASGASPPSAIRKDALNRLQLLNQIQSHTDFAPVSFQTAQMLASIFKDGGLADQVRQAFNEERWDDFNVLTKMVADKLTNKTMQSPTASDIWKTWRDQFGVLRQYAIKRDANTTKIMKMWDGTDRATGKKVSFKSKKGSLARVGEMSVKDLTMELEKANDEFIHQSLLHPPAIWDNWFNREYARRIMETDAGKEVAHANLEQLKKEGWTTKQANTLLEQNPQTLVEMGVLDATMSEENAMLGEVSYAESAQIKNEIYQQIANMRSMGQEPMYLPTVRITDEEKNWDRIEVHSDRVHKSQVEFEKNQKFNSGTIYDYQTAYNKVQAEWIQSFLEHYFQDHVMPNFIMDGTDLRHIIQVYFADEINKTADTMSFDDFADQKMQQWGFKEYTPKSIFSIKGARVLSGGKKYIAQDVAQALKERWQGNDLPGRIMDRSTGLFRSAILHWSPRFTLHVVVGGAMMLLAGISHPLHLIEILGNAWRFAASGEMPEAVKAKLAEISKPDESYLITQVRRAQPVQEGGNVDTLLDMAAKRSASHLVTQEYIKKFFGFFSMDDPNLMMKAITVWPRLNVKLTRFAYNMYHSAAFFDSFKTYERESYYMQEYYDEQDHTFKFRRTPMTADRMFDEAIKGASRVMGDVLAMTPIERNVMTRLFPFWSWTRHVFSYVARFPVDHPYRAMLFSQLARIGLAEQDQQYPGLPVRTQLLFFPGQPDAEGNVTAWDMRYANPLRDSATYLGFQGWISGLNPVLTALPNAIDPQYTFGSNVLYPNIHYDSVYGTNEATPSRTQAGLTIAEQYVPQLTGFDQYLNLSGQYAYLQKENRNAFITKVLGSFGADFFLPQHINLRQVAARNEIDRYNQAKKAASDAWSSGDFSGLQGYSEVPDPRYGQNPVVNIKPADLASLWQQEERTLILSGAAAQGATPANAYPGLSNPVL